MLLQNVLNALFDSKKFDDAVAKAGINKDACHELTCKIKRHVDPDYWYYDIYLNYNDPTSRNKDLAATVVFNEAGVGRVTSAIVL